MTEHEPTSHEFQPVFMGVDWGVAEGDKTVTFIQADLAKLEVQVLASVGVPPDFLLPPDAIKPNKTTLLELQRLYRTRKPLHVNSAAGRSLLGVFMLGERSRMGSYLRSLNRKRQRHVLRQRVRRRFHRAEDASYPEYANPRHQRH